MNAFKITAVEMLDEAQGACIAKLQDFGLAVEHLDQAALREDIFQLITTAMAMPAEPDLETWASKLAGELIKYCDLKSLDLGGLVGELKTQGLTPLVARKLTTFCDRTYLTLNGLVNEVWELRAERRRRATGEGEAHAQ